MFQSLEKTEPAWKAQLDTFDSFLRERLGFQIDSVVSRTQVEKDLAEYNRDGNYAPRVVVEYSDARSGTPGATMKETLPMMHTFDRESATSNNPASIFRLATRLRDSLRQLPDGERKSEIMLRHVSNLAHIADHDFTTHALGIDGVGKNIESESLRKLIAEIDFDKISLEADEVERVSAMCHRILFQEACQRSPVLERFTLSEAKRALRIASALEGKEKQEWLTAIKYLLYSLFDPEDERIKALREEYRNDPYRGLEPTEWANVVHQKIFKLKGSERTISDQDIFGRLYQRLAEQQ